MNPDTGFFYLFKLLFAKNGRFMYFILSFFIVAFGQPAYSGLLGLLAAILGFALFFRFLLSLRSAKSRFWWGVLWFTSVQVINLFWLTAHPYLYIYVVLFLFSFLFGLQFGCLACFITPGNVVRIPKILAISAFWVVMEWSRLFIFSGHSWNPVGMALASNIYSMQPASLFGVFGLSFLVILTNLLAIRAWSLGFARRAVFLCLLVASMPYIFGVFHVGYHKKRMGQLSGDRFSALLVQTAFPVEEALDFRSREEFLNFVRREWRDIFYITGEHRERSVNLVVLPEFVVPFGTYTFVYPYEDVERYVEEFFGSRFLSKLPALRLPLAYKTERGWLVSNAYFVQTLANIFDAAVIVGLEDAVDDGKQRRYFSAALYFEPDSRRRSSLFEPNRYAKRILVPMGEYIPFSFCRELAASYGVTGSFTPGTDGVVWDCDGVKLATSICYEETFGNLMRDNCAKGAKILVNITSDAWFPHSKLIRQHLEHARLRTVENGIPLIRSCNTGITCVVDSLGFDAALLGDDDKEREELRGALYAQVPMYTSKTLYSYFGDGLILLASFLLLFLFFV